MLFALQDFAAWCQKSLEVRISFFENRVLQYTFAHELAHAKTGKYKDPKRAKFHEVEPGFGH